MSAINYRVWTLKAKPGRFPSYGAGVELGDDPLLPTSRLIEVILDREVEVGEMFTLADLEILFWKVYVDARGRRPSRRAMSRSLSFMSDWVDASWGKKGKKDPIPCLLDHEDVLVNWEPQAKAAVFSWADFLNSLNESDHFAFAFYLATIILMGLIGWVLCL